MAYQLLDSTSRKDQTVRMDCLQLNLMHMRYE